MPAPRDDTCGGGTCNGGRRPNCTTTTLHHRLRAIPRSGASHANNTNPCNDGTPARRATPAAAAPATAGRPQLQRQQTLAPTIRATRRAAALTRNNTNSCSDGNACTAMTPVRRARASPRSRSNCNDGNVCTTDSCNRPPDAFDYHITLACSDGLSCTVNDTCGGGVCVGGPPSTPSCQDPKTIGFYKRLCDGPHPEDELTQANVDCVNDWSTFAR
jgi:hypothetical protein